MAKTTIAVDSVVAQGRFPRTTRVGRRREGMSLELGHHLGLDRVGARIWQMLEQPRSVRSLCQQVSEEFGFEAEACARDVIALLALLARDRLIRVVA